LLAFYARDDGILVWPVPRVEERDNGSAVKANTSLLDKWWTDLAREDAHCAYIAIGGLSRAPADTLHLFRKRLHPFLEAPSEKVQALIADLDAHDFHRREVAAKELEVLAEQAGSALRAALERPSSSEQRRRIEPILDSSAPLAPETIRSVRAAEVLERIGNADALELLRKLAAGMPEARLTREAQASLRRLTHRD
jgi:hypothetical protein